MTPDTCKPESVTAQLERILGSSFLESSPSLCRFLRYVVEETLAGRSGSLKEYSLGVVAFHRGEEFDPRMDPIVRVQARNLRVRLGQYYAGPGAGDPIVIELPKRTYVPVFRNRVEEAPASEIPLTAAAVALPSEAIIPTEILTAGLDRPWVTSGVPASARARRVWKHPVWAIVTAVLIAIVATSAVWRSRLHETHAKAAHDPDPVAQDLYIRGRYLMDRLTEPALHGSIDAFRQAVDRDPNFAAAWAGLADAYNILAQHGYMAPGEGMEQARRGAERALAIDPGLAEGHVSLAAVIEAYDWNWVSAEREYRRALQLNPSLPAAHLWYGMFLRDQGRLQEALPELRRAAQLEPFSVLTTVNLAHAYMLSGNYAAAVEQAHHATEVAPDLVTAECILAYLYGVQDQTAEAEAALARGLQYSRDDPHALATLARAYAKRGRKDESAKLFHQLEELAKQRYVSPFDLGTVSLILGDEKRAVDLLEEAFRQRSAGMIFLREARFSSGSGASQVHQLIEKMHFAS